MHFWETETGEIAAVLKMRQMDCISQFSGQSTICFNLGKNWNKKKRWLRKMQPPLRFAFSLCLLLFKKLLPALQPTMQ